MESAAGTYGKGGAWRVQWGLYQGLHGKRGAQRAHGERTGDAREKGCTESSQGAYWGCTGKGVHGGGPPGALGELAGVMGVQGRDAGGAPGVPGRGGGVYVSPAPFFSPGPAGSPRPLAALPPASGAGRGGLGRPLPPGPAHRAPGPAPLPTERNEGRWPQDTPYTPPTPGRGGRGARAALLRGGGVNLVVQNVFRCCNPPGRGWGSWAGHPKGIWTPKMGCLGGFLHHLPQQRSLGKGSSNPRSHGVGFLGVGVLLDCKCVLIVQNTPNPCTKTPQR